VTDVVRWNDGDAEDLVSPAVPVNERWVGGFTAESCQRLLKCVVSMGVRPQHTDRFWTAADGH